MRKKTLFIMLLCLMAPIFLFAQTYNIVIKGGHVIDPKNNIDEPMDIAVKDGKIALVAKNIDAREGSQVINATGMYVTPGLIDMHVHARPASLPFVDVFTFRSGVTTVVDAGSIGWRYFDDFKKQVIDISETRVLAFLHVVGEGMRDGPLRQNLKDMLVRPIVEYAQKYPEYIVGFKIAHYVGHDWTPILRGTEAGRIMNLPLMVDLGSATPPLPLDSLFLHYLNPGDIFTHCFAQLGGSRESLVDVNTGQLRPFMAAARERGIFFDVGHGQISLAYSQAIPAVKAGFYPDAISTDIHVSSLDEVIDQLNIMDKFLAFGMDLKSVIEASTWKPAQMIKRTDLGHLSVGSEADIAILSRRTGKFGLWDYLGNKLEVEEKFECEMTIRAGNIVYDLNGIATPIRLIRGR
jgi:dihydroorotase